jgi:hypothetical protein
MQAHRTRATVTEDHEIQVTLPPEFPLGEAEVIVIAKSPPRVMRPGETPAMDFNSWLDRTLCRLPPAPSPPLDALRRENVC